MKIKSTIIILLLVFSLLFVAFKPSLINSGTNLVKENIGVVFDSDLIPHDPIKISGDSSIGWYLYANGSGTPENPFIIENYNITHDGSYGPYETAIHISYTSKNFILRNCFIKGFAGGVLITECDAAGIIVENLTVLDSGTDPFKISFTDDFTVKNCYISLSKLYGISCSGDNSLIENCTVSYCAYTGIDVEGQNTNVTKCEVFENKDGIDCDYLYESRIYENIIRDNSNYGIKVDQLSSDNLIYRNDFVRNNPEGTSQANNDGEDNLFYNPQLLEGNYWHGHKRGEYFIDGLAGSTDPYIQTGPVIRPIEYYGGGVPFSLASMFLAFCFLLVIKLITRRKNR